MHLSPAFIQHLSDAFSSFFKENITVSEYYKVDGGDISQVYVLVTEKGKFFCKQNAALFGLDFFEKEARGLAMLANGGALKIPRPLFDGKFHQEIFLVMEYLERGEPAADFWTDFGQSMANLHRNSADQFGLEYDNYLGKIKQLNSQCSNWPEFYAQQRIMPLVNKAFRHKLLPPEDVQMAELICTKFADLMPEEKPALLHGDLWKGNFLAMSNGHVALFDPAVHYGHREMDLGMAQLFGGFDPSFYDAYVNAYPLEPGFESRKELLQLYPLLAHLLLFGGPYYKLVKKVLEKFQ